MKLLIALLFISLSSFAQKKYESEGQKFIFEVLTQQNDVIWGFDFFPDGKIIFTERNGFIKIFDPKTNSVVTLSGTPTVWANGQGGMLDVRVHYKDPKKIYFTFAEPIDRKATTTLATAELDGTKLVNFKKIFSAEKPNDNVIHFGSRIEFDRKGHVFVSVGDRNERKHVQKLEYTTGKILRLKEDGSIPSDNPFSGTKNAKKEIWSYGHRNPQGLFFNESTNDLWSAEMGPRGGDELNLILPGKNYGWPEVTYGREYFGPKIGEPSKEGMEPPKAYWVPSISPSGMTIYNGDVFPKWKGNLFLGCLSGTHLRRLTLKDQKVVAQEELLKDKGFRFRMLRTGPDGFLYLSTDDGKIARLKSVK